MKPAEFDIENRRPVWVALSDLFLDTELEEYNFSHIARTLAQSLYALSEVEAILYREVYPVLIPNLKGVGGEWAGFSEEWLEASILKHIKRRWAIGNPFQPRRWMIRDNWNRVKVQYVEQLDTMRDKPSESN